MSKVLISFIGTGPQEGDRESRSYRKALYKYEKQEKGSEFVALALKEFFHPDKMFLIGTPHSMWEKVYDSFYVERYKDEAQESNIETWDDIDTWCRNANSNTPAEGLPHKKEIEKAMGEGSKAILIRYGIDEAQIQENINIILGIRNYLKSGDEIIVDITHSFRSLPVLIMQLILYLKQIENPKVKISHVCYGMLDVSRDLGYAPIVELNKIVELTDWITGAYSFKLTGSASKICSLIKDENKSTSSNLEKFSLLLSLNDLGQLQNFAPVLSGLKKGNYKTDLETLAIQPTVDDFIRTFKQAKKASRFQYELAKWQCEKMNYFASYTTLVESIITKVCEMNNLNWQDKDKRDYAREFLRNKSQVIEIGLSKCPQKLIEVYKEVNPIRNALVHQNGNDSKSARQMVKILVESLKTLNDYMTKELPSEF